MAKYLLPCKCGAKIRIDVSQAGQQLKCECGQTVEVPTLRGVRELEQAADDVAPKRSSSDWNPVQGMIFAGSLLLVVIGSGVSYFGYDSLRKTPNITHEIEQEAFATAIDDMSIDQAYEMWQYVRDEGLGTHGENVYVNIRTFRASRKRVLIAGVVLCALGTLGTVFALVAGGRK